MPDAPRDIYTAFALNGSYVVVQGIGLRHRWPRYVDTLGSIVVTTCLLGLILALDGISPAIAATVFAVAVVYLSPLVAKRLAGAFWKRELAASRENAEIARAQLAEFETRDRLEPADCGPYTLAALESTTIREHTRASQVGTRFDLPALDALLAKHNIRRPVACLDDVRSALADTSSAVRNDVRHITLPAARPLIALPWVALAALAWLIWRLNPSETATIVALSFSLTALVKLVQGLSSASAWGMGEWRVDPGRLGLCGNATPIEVANDTHMMVVHRLLDGSMWLTFIDAEGISLSVNAGRRNGERYRSIWRAWMYDGDPAPSLLR